MARGSGFWLVRLLESLLIDKHGPSPGLEEQKALIIIWGHLHPKVAYKSNSPTLKLQICQNYNQVLFFTCNAEPLSSGPFTLQICAELQKHCIVQSGVKSTIQLVHLFYSNQKKGRISEVFPWIFNINSSTSITVNINVLRAFKKASYVLLRIKAPQWLRHLEGSRFDPALGVSTCPWARRRTPDCSGRAGLVPCMAANRRWRAGVCVCVNGWMKSINCTALWIKALYKCQPFTQNKPFQVRMSQLPHFFPRLCPSSSTVLFWTGTGSGGCTLWGVVRTGGSGFCDLGVCLSVYF